MVLSVCILITDKNYACIWKSICFTSLMIYHGWYQLVLYHEKSLIHLLHQFHYLLQTLMRWIVHKYLYNSSIVACKHRNTFYLSALYCVSVSKVLYASPLPELIWRKTNFCFSLRITGDFLCSKLNIYSRLVARNVRCVHRIDFGS